MPTPPSSQAQQATIAVTEWIREALGHDACLTWLWQCTPFPCGLPSDDQLHEGIAVALGDLPLETLVAQYDRHLREALEAEPWA